MNQLTDVALATITRVAESDEYWVTVEGVAKNDTIHIDNIIAIIPSSDNSATGHSYVLAAISSPENTGDASKLAPTTNGFLLKKYRISQPPSELTRFVTDQASSPFFGLTNLDKKAPELSIIVSLKSGTCQAESFFKEVVQDLLSLLGLTKDVYNVYFTDSEDWIAKFSSKTLARKANDGIAQSVLLLSGDGGIIDVLNGLTSHQQSIKYVRPTIGLLVLGTGNALANSSGLNVGNTKGLSTLLTGSPQPIPTFICRCSPGSVLLINEGRDTEQLQQDETGCGVLHGAVVASWCLHATLVANSDTTEYRKFGSQRFSMAAGELLAPADGSSPHKWTGQITTYYRSLSGDIQTKVWERKEHMYILATLVSNLEATLKISPDSKPLDGELRLVEFPPLPADDVKNIFGMAFSGGKHIEHDSVGYESIEGLRIDFEETNAAWRRVCIDGKIIRVPESGWIEIKLEKHVVADLVIPRQ